MSRTNVNEIAVMQLARQLKANLRISPSELRHQARELRRAADSIDSAADCAATAGGLASGWYVKEDGDFGCVYALHIHDPKLAYIGQSRSFYSRIQAHFIERDACSKIGSWPSWPTVRILHDGVPLDQLKMSEERWMLEYADSGYDLVNRSVPNGVLFRGALDRASKPGCSNKSYIFVENCDEFVMLHLTEPLAALNPILLSWLRRDVFESLAGESLMTETHGAL